MRQGLTCIVLFFHFLADFVFQTNWMANNKSKNWRALSCHVGETFLVLAVGLSLRQAYLTFQGHHPREFLWVGVFCGVNSFMHFFIDAVTSRAASHFNRLGQTHAFFSVIGFDQFLHLSLFMLTLPLLP